MTSDLKNQRSIYKKLSSFIITLALCLCFSLYCHNPDQAAEKKANPQRKPFEQAEFLNILKDAQKHQDIPGIAGVVVTSEGIVHKGAVGVRRVDSDDQITLNDRFHIGSNTKAMTGFLAGILVEQELIRWETRILEVFPEMKSAANDSYFSATLRDLLSHRARIPPFKNKSDFDPVPEYEGSAIEIRRAFTGWLLQQKPAAMEPRGYTYSNAGYSIAAAMLEKVSGRSWERLMQEELFEPLGINAAMQWPASLDKNQPWGHWVQGGSFIPHNPNDSYQLPEIIRPAGDINMSIQDYAKFLQVLLRGIKGQDTVIKSTTAQFLLYGNMEFSPYSIGWGSREREGLTVSGHDGSAGTFYCHAEIVKELDLAIALMANSATGETSKTLHDISRKIIERYKNPFSKANTSNISEAQTNKWQTLAGEWRNASQSESFLRQILEKSEITALSVAVVQGNHVVFQKYMGIIDAKTKMEVDAKTVFRTASLSKPVFAYLVMRLVEKGKIDVDKPLYQYLDRPLHEYPVYKDLKGDNRYKLITTRIVLSHMTGFPNWRVTNPDRRLDFKFTPGEKFKYAGEGYRLLQFILEKMSEKGLNTLAEENIFAPLGMAQTSFLWEKRFESNIAVYLNTGLRRLIKRTKTVPNAAASLLTNTTDYAKFLLALVNGKGLKPETFEMMLEPQIDITSESLHAPQGTNPKIQENIGLSWSLGWGRFRSPYGEAIFHVGREEGCDNYVVVFLDPKLGFVLQSVTPTYEGIAPQIAEELIGDIYSPFAWLGY